MPTSRSTLRDKHIGCDVYEGIIAFGPDRVSLRIWQKVCYSAYLVATPKLYSQTVTLHDPAAYMSFFSGAVDLVPAETITTGSLSRLLSKRELLLETTCLRITGSELLDFPSCDGGALHQGGRLMRNFKKVMIMGPLEAWDLPDASWSFQSLVRGINPTNLDSLELEIIPSLTGFGIHHPQQFERFMVANLLKCLQRGTMPRLHCRIHDLFRSKSLIPRLVHVVHVELVVGHSRMNARQEEKFTGLSRGALGFDFFEPIIALSSDRQTLHLWQRVCYTTYLIATPLLYARPVNLTTNIGYNSFSHGAREPSAVCADFRRRLLPKHKTLGRTSTICLGGRLYSLNRNRKRLPSVKVGDFTTRLRTVIVKGPRIRRPAFHDPNDPFCTPLSSLASSKVEAIVLEIKVKPDATRCFATADRFETYLPKNLHNMFESLDVDKPRFRCEAYDLGNIWFTLHFSKVAVVEVVAGSGAVDYLSICMLIIEVAMRSRTD